jgi:hypothetical protein
MIGTEENTSLFICVFIIKFECLFSGSNMSLNIFFTNTFEDQGSISPTFYAQLLRQQSCPCKVQTST